MIGDAMREAFGLIHIGSAILSPCGKYRYRLERQADPFGSGSVNFIMLNPSTADATVDDPTIRRCVGFAKSWGYARLIVTNLFAFRATDPAELRGKTSAEIVGPDNDRHLIDALNEADRIVCAWGAGGGIYGRDNYVRLMLAKKPLAALKLTKHGHLQHPLYIPANTSPVAF